MVGTFGGALEARQIDASDGKLTADVTGEVEQEAGFTSRCVWQPRKKQERRSSACTPFIP
jgi:hypothetical protein